MKWSKDFLNFFGFWVVNAIVLLIASLTVQNQVVIGTLAIAPYFGLVWTSLLLTIVITAVEPIIKYLKIEMKNEIYMGIIYLIINVGTIWILGRAAMFTGFGISSYWVAIILGFILNILQYGFWKWAESKQTKVKVVSK